MGQQERNAGQWLRDNVVNARRKDRFTRVENVTMLGMFDINYCFEGIEGWIELKAPEEKVKMTTPLFAGRHGFTQDQKNFAQDQLKAGGNCWAFVSTEQRQFLLPGRFIEEANELSMEALLLRSLWIREKGELLAGAGVRLRGLLMNKVEKFA